MKFFDKLNQLTDKIVSAVEETAKDVNQTYKERGLNGFLDRANTNLDNLAKSTQDYYNKLAEDNKKITKANTSTKFEDKIATVAAVVVNTTQTLVDDVVKATVNTAKNVVDTKGDTTTAKDSVNAQKEVINDWADSNQEFKDKAATHTKAPKAPVYKTFDQLTEAEFVSLNSTPLEIVLDNLGALPAARGIPGKFTTETGGSVMLTHNKWYSFTTGLGSEGAVSLVKFSLSKEFAIKLEDPQADNMLLNEAVGMLQAMQAEPTYQADLSAWMKKQKVTNVTTIDDATPVVKTVKPKTKKVTVKAPEVVEEVKPVVKRTRKAAVVETPVIEATVEEVVTPKRTRKAKM